MTATLSLAVVLAVIAGVLPSVAAQATVYEPGFESRLAAADTTDKLAVAEGSAAQLAFTSQARTATYIAPPPPPKTASAPRATARTTSSGGTATAAAPAGDELSRARSILAGLISRHPILAGTTVEFGDAKGYQAIAYYKSGRIVISSSHTASLDRILSHEIWHVIDWRDNGVIDWGESVPPK